MNKLTKTLIELMILQKSKVKFVLTRFWRNSTKMPDDLDILVSKQDFPVAISLLENLGYQSFSHDQALGGRIKGMQKNLVKHGRIKIDLHQDFTWKKSRYLDLNLIWKNLENQKVDQIDCLMPKIEIDIFIILINIIFEKTYITKEDFRYIAKFLAKVFQDQSFESQAKKYGWFNTFKLFRKWFPKSKKKFPLFLPVYLVIFSYIEKMIHEKKVDLVSLLYYFFFRSRFQINGVLPYE